MAAFTPTEDQARALKAVSDLLQTKGAQRDVINGYAGTGKTTLIRQLQRQFGEVVVMAPTGKAALRVSSHTEVPATTIHKRLYRPVLDEETGDVSYVLVAPEEFDTTSNRLVLIDESSMVDSRVWKDLWAMAEALELKVVCLGDGFQLPPVMVDAEDGVFSLLDPKLPHRNRVDLTQIVRQALDNPIIRASMLIRQNRVFEGLLDLPKVKKDRILDTALGVLSRGGVVICHKNSTRHLLNTRIRSALGKPPDSLVEGEPLLVLKNNYALERFNGEVIRFEGWRRKPDTNTTTLVRDPWANKSKYLAYGLAETEPLFEGEGTQTASLSEDQVFGQADELSQVIIGREGYRMFRHENEHGEWDSYPHLHANLGYALTCHKSQGSEWPEALVLVEKSVQYQTYNGRRWLYTALTRAKNKVQVCLLSEDYA